MSFFSQNTPKSMSDPTGELTAPPQTSSWFQGSRFMAGGEWRGELGAGKTGKGEEGNGEGRGKGEVEE